MRNKAQAIKAIEGSCQITVALEGPGGTCAIGGLQYSVPKGEVWRHYWLNEVEQWQIMQLNDGARLKAREISFLVTRYPTNAEIIAERRRQVIAYLKSLPETIITFGSRSTGTGNTTTQQPKERTQLWQNEHMYEQ